MSAPLMELRDAGFSYRGRAVLSGIGLEIRGGRPLVIYGPSGAGKTTLTKILAAHLAPTSGEVRLEGESYARPSRRVFYIHQEDDLFDWLTVEGHLELCVRLGARIEDGLALVRGLELESSLKLYPSQLSSGMKKRLAVIRALLMNPRILILDETLSALDSRQRQLIFERLEEWAADPGAPSRACVFVSHFPDDFPAGRVRLLRLDERGLTEEER